MQPSLCEEELYRKAEVTAAGMLSRRPLSAAMLERKLLEKEFPPDAAAYAVERMRVLHAIDDTAYGELLLRSYARKGYGALRIRQEMRQRGVPQDVATALLEQFEPDPEILEALLDKKLRGDVSDRREREKAMAALQRRGFTFSQIREAMADYCAAIAEEETR